LQQAEKSMKSSFISSKEKANRHPMNVG